MDRILEHVVDEVRIGLDEVVELAQYFQVLSLLLVEQIEADLILVEFHPVDSRLELVSLVLDHLFSFLDFILFLLELLNFLIYLLFHHLEQILVLDF